MNTTVNHKTLNAAARIVARVVSSRTTLPVLAQCHLQAGNGCLAISSTDLDQTITTMIKSETKDTGHCLVPAKRFASVVASCKGNVELDYKDKQGLHILNGATFRLLTMDVEEFPPQATLKEPQSFEVKANELKRALKRVEYAMSTDESRYVLNGVCFELIAKGTLRLIATDGRRLTHQDLASSWPHDPPKVEEKNKPAYEKPIQLLVPTKTINLLISIPHAPMPAMVRFASPSILPTVWSWCAQWMRKRCALLLKTNCVRW